MKLRVQLDGMIILAETPQDTIYRQKMLKLVMVGDSCRCTLQMDERSGERYIEICPSPEEVQS